MPDSPTSVPADAPDASKARSEVPTALAVDVLLADDVRNVKTQLEDLLQDLKLERSDATRYVRLAKAKRLCEHAFPEVAHGKGGKDPKSGSMRRCLAFVDYAKKKTGWSRSSIGAWASTGERLTDAAFKELKGTKLANRAGALRKLADLGAREQLLVARGFRVGLENDAIAMLNAYHAKFEQEKARAAALAGEPPPPVYADDNNVVVPVSAEGVECTLHGHVLRVSVEGQQVRVRYLAHTLRPRELAAEGWIDGVENAARSLRGCGFEVDVAPIEVVRFRTRGMKPADAVRHEIRIRAWREASITVILVTRWETACHSGPPLFDPCPEGLREVKGAVVTVARSTDPPGWPLSVDRADIARAVEVVICRLVHRVAQHDDGASKEPATTVLGQERTAEQATSEKTPPPP